MTNHPVLRQVVSDDDSNPLNIYQCGYFLNEQVYWIWPFCVGAFIILADLVSLGAPSA